MKVLIVESNSELGALWQGHLARRGFEVDLVGSADAALTAIRAAAPDVIVADADMENALSVADYAAYRRPEARLIFVTASTFFSDGSIFELSPNACAFLPARTSPEDLAAVVEYHARRDGADG